MTSMIQRDISARTLQSFSGTPTGTMFRIEYSTVPESARKGWQIDSMGIIPFNMPPIPVPPRVGSIVSGNTDNRGYTPQMVECLLRLDAEAPEATFSNFKGMMDWLDGP